MRIGLLNLVKKRRNEGGEFKAPDKAYLK